MQDMKTKATGGVSVLILLVLLSIFALRLPSSAKAMLGWDESIYFYVAQDMVDGGVPYKTAFDNKGPILFFALTP